MMQGMQYRISSVALFLTIAFFALPAHAQYNIPDASAALSISLSPTYPQPGQTVNLSLSSTLYDLGESVVVWRANGRVIAEGEGVTETRVTAGERGTITTVSAAIAGGVASTEVSIRPTEISILWESDSHTPPFFSGRALPSAGTSVKLHAITYFAEPGKAEISPNNIIFTWKRNGGTLRDVSGRGKASATIDAPYLFGADTISVEAVSADGTIAGSASVRIPSVEPLLTLYQRHPIFGTMYYSALTGTSFVSESEMSFSAEPYYADAKTARDPLLAYEWQVNSAAVTADATDPNTITIDASRSTGIARIDLDLYHRTNLFLSGSGTWLITFTRAGNGGAGSVDPFTRQ